MLKNYKKWIKPLARPLAKPLIIGVALMLLVVVFYFDTTSSSDEEYSDLDGWEQIQALETVDQPKKSVPAYSFSQAPSTRDLVDYYDTRQYPGAPPVIPHSLSQDEGDFNCMSCHKLGGYVPKFSAYTPVTPHPQFVNCQQCHVPGAGEASFKGVGIDWVSVMPPKTKRAAIVGGPPPIPHTLNMRQNCIACHAGPGAVKQIRTSHPERVNCVQCHVPQKNGSGWARN